MAADEGCERDLVHRMNEGYKALGALNVIEMKCLRSLVGVSRLDRVRNQEVRRRAGMERELASRADQRVLRWFGHVERIYE